MLQMSYLKFFLSITLVKAGKFINLLRLKKMDSKWYRYKMEYYSALKKE